MDDPQTAYFTWITRSHIRFIVVLVNSYGISSQCHIAVTKLSRDNLRAEDFFDLVLSSFFCFLGFFAGGSDVSVSFGAPVSA